MANELSFERICLGGIDGCYSALGVELEGEPCLFFGGEGEGSVRAFRGAGFERCERVWRGGGGTMSIVPFPGRADCVLASRGFYDMVNSAGSAIEIVRWRGGAFSHEPIARLDYLHRFDALRAPGGALYLLAASLHGGKADVNDWSKPGHLYAAALPEDVERPFRVELAQLPGDFYMNHGFFKGAWAGREAAFISSREGVFAVLPPERPGADWQVERLMDAPVSDIALCDIDGDGEQELAALMPFHGDEFRVFHRDGAGWREMYRYPAGNDFYHAVAAGRICGEPVFVGGARRGDADTFLVRWDARRGEIFAQRLEAGGGASNVAILNSARGDYLLCANRAAQEAVALKF